MTRCVLGAAVALTSLVGLGCGPQCPPEDDITVTFVEPTEDVRAIPLIASGATSLLETDVPDSHGTAAVKVQIEGGVDNVIFDSLTFEQQVAGGDKAIELVRVLAGTTEFEDAVEVPNQTPLSFHWRVRELAEYALEEGAAHTSTITANWRYSGCRTQTGTATLQVPGTIKQTNNLKNFTLESAEAGRLDPAQGAKAKMVLKNPSTSDFITGLDPLSYQVVFFSEGLPPIIGLGVAVDSVMEQRIARQSNGMGKSQLNVGESVEVFTSNDPGAQPAPYVHTGQAAATAALVGGGKAVVTLKIQSQRGTSVMPPVTDTISALVDVP